MKEFLNLYKRYLQFTSKYKLLYLTGWIGAILLLVSYNLIPLAIGDIIDSAQSTEDLNLVSLVLLIGALIAAPIILEPLTFYPKARHTSFLLRDMVDKVYKNVINQDYDYHVNKQTGKMISIIVNTRNVIDMFLWRLEWFTLENLGNLVIPIIILVTISPNISLIILVTLIISYPFLYLTLKYNISKRAVLKDAEYARNSAIIDGVSNFETVRSFGKEQVESDYLAERTEEVRNAHIVYQDTFRIIDFAARLVGILVFILPAIYAESLYSSDDISLGAIVVVLTYLTQMSGRVMGIIFNLRDLLKDLPNIQDYYELLDAKSSIKESTSPIFLENVKGAIEFSNVNFGYSKNLQVLNNLSLKVAPEQTVALVGTSGGGKTTVTRLLMRYYDVWDGAIKIDGVEVKTLANASLRDIIGLVPQEPVLFNRSIFYNVGYALPNINQNSKENMKIVTDACRKARIHDFIVSLKDGYATKVGERGLKLSGGQKQRVAIARAIIKNPKIVIFDEATSMLDSESEKAIQEAFTELSKDKTVIIIAHRLSTITHCDNIFVIENGKVIEKGKHEELLKNSKSYSKLWYIQSGGFERADSKY